MTVWLWLWLLRTSPRSCPRRVRRGIVKLQSFVRRRGPWRRFQRNMFAVRMMHFLARGFAIRHQLMHQADCIRKIQRIVRGFLVRNRMHWAKVKSALALQSLFRGYRWRAQHARLVGILAKRLKALRTVRAIARFQAAVRSKAVRVRYYRVKGATCVIQAWVLRYILVRRFAAMRAAAPVIQALARGCVMRGSCVSVCVRGDVCSSRVTPPVCTAVC